MLQRSMSLRCLHRRKYKKTKNEKFEKTMKGGLTVVHKMSYDFASHRIASVNCALFSYKITYIRDG